MFCPHCGKELPPGTNVCDSCAAASNSSQDADIQGSEYSDATTEPIAPSNGSKPRKPRKKVVLKVVAIFLIAIFFISGITVLGYFTFLPAKPTLRAAKYFTQQKSYKQLDKTLTRKEKEIGALYSTPVKTDTRISISMDTDFLTAFGMDQTSASLVVDFIKGFSLQTKSQVDYSKKKENFDISLNYLNNPMLTASGFLDGDRVGISLPELSQKNVVGRFTDLSRLAELYPDDPSLAGLTSLSNMDPWLSSSIWREFVFEHEDIKKLMETYGMLLVNNVDSKNMSIKRGSSTQLFGENITCQEVTITLDKKAQLDLVDSFVDTMIQDDILYDVLFSKIVSIAKTNPALSQSMQGADIMSLLDKSRIRLALSTLRHYLTEDMFAENIVVKAYIKGFDIVKYEIDISSNTESFLISYERLFDGDASKKRFTMVANSATVTLDINSRYDEKTDMGDLSVVFDIDTKGVIDFSMDIALNTTEDPDGNNGVKGKSDFSISYSMSGDYVNPVGFEISILADTLHIRNRDGLPVNSDMTADVILSFPTLSQEPIGFSVAFESDMEYGITVETPEWTGNNVIDLATASREDLDAYAQEIASTISSIMQLLSFMY